MLEIQVLAWNSVAGLNQRQYIQIQSNLYIKVTQWNPENVPFMSSCPLYIQVKIICTTHLWEKLDWPL